MRGLTKRNEGKEEEREREGKEKERKETLIPYRKYFMVQHYERSSSKKKPARNFRFSFFPSPRLLLDRLSIQSPAMTTALLYIPSTFFFFSPQILAVLALDAKLCPCLLFASLTVLPDVKISFPSFILFFSFQISF